MSVSAPESVLSRLVAFQSLSATLAEGALCAEADGLWGSARALVLAAFMHDTARPVLTLSASAADRHHVARDLAFFYGTLAPTAARGEGGSAAVLEFPSEQPAAWRGARHREHDAERALCCHRLMSGAAVAVSTTPAGLSLPLLPPAEFRARTFALAVGESLDRDDLL